MADNVIDFMSARAKRRDTEKIYNFKVRTQADHEFLIANRDRIMITIGREESNHDEKES